jgi:hypothetical protein
MVAAPARTRCQSSARSSGGVFSLFSRNAEGRRVFCLRFEGFAIVRIVQQRLRSPAHPGSTPKPRRSARRWPSYFTKSNCVPISFIGCPDGFREVTLDPRLGSGPLENYAPLKTNAPQVVMSA